ncbi:lipopolysaccharide biosynthesis [Alphaproteobacteria bacterium GH1-50]|uniref:Lipopolysaccharide biosynthesis n=1 Tax=Kangsaoukella pontilimi TaxID=2691042 RepID=A0A7C9IFW9_9RHOB|nr:lipopolysaccharide biosynthesis [Kangsaoukella pontilimi]MXQ06422.1 lipopolysaccharide biosynthesis [Kangsaoukella pontilimi]
MNSDVKFYWSVFLQRLPVMLVVFVICSAVGVGLSLTLPPSYRATTSLLVESPQIPDELAASTVQLPSQEQLEIIEQRLMRRANMIDLANEFRIFENGPRLNPDEVVQQMREKINIRTSAGRDRATLMNISFTHDEPQSAASVVNQLTSLILNEDSVRRQALAEQTLDFFEQEVERLDADLSQKSVEILEFKEANSDALPESLGFKLERQNSLRDGIARARSELGQILLQRNRLVELGTAAVNSAPQRVTANQSQLTAAEAELSEARLIYSDSNPRIRVLEARVQSLRAQVAAETGVDASSEDPARTVLNLQLSELSQREAAINEDIARAEAELEALEEAINRTPQNAIRLEALERDYANIQAQHNRALNNLARAQTGERIEVLSKGQRITVLEQAVPPTEPTSPNRPLIAGGGVMLGTGLAGAFFILAELLNRAIRRPVELTKALGVQPLATIPYLETTGGRRRKRLLSTLVILAIAIGIPAILWWVHTQYLPLDLIFSKIMDRLRP